MTDQPKTALITGVTGQDGSYLAELLLGKGYLVRGVTRDKSSQQSRQLLEWLQPHPRFPAFQLHESEITTLPAVDRLIRLTEPDEIYNLAAQSHVGLSFSQPMETLAANTAGLLAILETVRQLAGEREIRVYQASSSEMFGAPAGWPQTEQTPFHPRNPYACAKVCAYHLLVNYREAYNLFACNGILYNHESPRRDPAYVTRKITLAAARIAAGLQQTLSLGNLNIGRDWGFAGEYVEATWRTLQRDQPDDYVIATNQWHTLESFLDTAFSAVGLSWREHVVKDDTLFRPAEVTRLQGDYSKAREILGWEPRTSFSQLVARMVASDVSLVANTSSSLLNPE